MCCAARAQTFSTVYTFLDGVDGGHSNSKLFVDKSGEAGYDADTPAGMQVTAPAP